MKATTLLISLFSALPLQAQETYLQTDFNTGIPSDYTNIDVDELPIGNGFSIPVSNNWFAQSIYGAEGKAAVSTSRHTFELPAENWLITPAFEVKSANAIFAWDAKSVHYDLRDGYKIMISTSGTETENFEELYTVEKESYTWQHHVVSLAKYAGKKVNIAVLHNSQNKFLLAVDNFFAGEPKHLAFDAKNDTKKFCGNTGKTNVEGTLRNIGTSTSIAKVVCTSGLNVFTEDINNLEMNTGAVTDFKFEIPVTLNTAVPYQIDVVTTAGETIKVLEDNIICSYFPRTLLVEKGTGVGCTACPGLMGYMNELKEEYKDEIVEIESHSPYFDTGHFLSYDVYDKGMATSNYPVLYFNRNQKMRAYSKPEANNILKEILKEETVAAVEAKAEMLNKNMISVKADMHFGKQIDNSKGQFRIGFAILEKHVKLPFDAQKSAVSGAAMQEFGLLSSPFNKDLVTFHNVARGTSSAFNGLTESLPANIEAGATYKYDGVLNLPKGKKSSEGLTVVAFILDYFNNRVLNTVEVKITDATGIEQTAAEQLNADIRLTRQQCHVLLPANTTYRISVYDQSGRQVTQVSATGNKHSISTSQWGKGTFIIEVQQDGKTLIQKIQNN